MSGRSFLVWCVLVGVSAGRAPAAETRYVSTNSLLPTYPYTSWPTASHGIPEALVGAADGCLVLVTDGVYNLSVFVHVGNAITVRSVNGASGTIVDGGGSQRCFLLNDSNAVVRGFTIQAGSDAIGAGVFCSAGGSIENCILRNNSASSLGGGAYLSVSGTMQNCQLVGNSAPLGGGAYLDNGGLVLNCTIVSNSGSVRGGGLYCMNTGTVRNTIIYFNASLDGSNYYNDGSSWAYSYSCMAPGIVSPGNISSNPLFAATNGLFRLGAGSPCIDTAWTLPVPIPADDLEGVPRPLDGDGTGTTNLDMGCFEFASTNKDVDGDGLSDAAEAYIYRTNPKSADTDADAQSDADEVWAGTDPLAGSSYFRVTWHALTNSGNRLVRWPGVTSRQYTLFRATNLVSGPKFATVVSNLAASPPENTYTDTAPPAAHGFYRVGVQK